MCNTKMVFQASERFGIFSLSTLSTRYFIILWPPINEHITQWTNQLSCKYAKQWDSCNAMMSKQCNCTHYQPHVSFININGQQHNSESFALLKSALSVYISSSSHHIIWICYGTPIRSSEAPKLDIKPKQNH